jgi:hypothetical protein
MVPITREWFLDMLSAIKVDQELDYKAGVAPDRVEIHLYDPPRRSVVTFHSSAGIERVEIHFRDASHRTIVFPPDRVELHLPDTPEQWHPDEIDAMRGRTVVMFPTNTEASWNHARSIAQKLRGVAASIRLIDMRNMKNQLQNELAACELWGFWLCLCQHNDHLTIGDEHFRNDCKKHQNEKRLAGLSAYQAHKGQS